jgi:hypothetical protein
LSLDCACVRLLRELVAEFPIGFTHVDDLVVVAAAAHNARDDWRLAEQTGKQPDVDARRCSAENEVSSMRGEASQKWS